MTAIAPIVTSARSVCTPHSCALLKPFDGMKCHLAGDSSLLSLLGLGTLVPYGYRDFGDGTKVEICFHD